MLKRSTLRMLSIVPVLLSALLLLGAAAVQGDEKKPGIPKSDSKVKATVKSTKPTADGKQTITLDLAIEKGWYIYANPVGNEDFEPNHTEVKIKGGKVKAAAVKVAYPAGKVYAPEGVGKFHIYEDKVTLVAVVQREAGDQAALEIAINVNACSKGEGGKCLLPGVVKVTVDAEK